MSQMHITTVKKEENSCTNANHCRIKKKYRIAGNIGRNLFGSLVRNEANLILVDFYLAFWRVEVIIIHKVMPQLRARRA